MELSYPLSVRSKPRTVESFLQIFQVVLGGKRSLKCSENSQHLPKERNYPQPAVKNFCPSRTVSRFFFFLFLFFLFLYF